MRLQLLLGLLVSSACASRLEGPQPAVTSAAPAIVCTEQVATTVLLSGSGFAPLVTKGLEETPTLVLPWVTLARSLDLAGAAGTPFEKAIPDDPADAAASQVRWLSAESLSFEVTPALALEPGLYDVQLLNASGGATTAAGALLAVPRPSLTGVAPQPLCTRLGGRLTLTGTGFLTIADALPTVRIGDESFVPEPGGCEPLPGGASARSCKELVIDVAADVLGAGALAVVVTNPAPAACASTEPTTVTFVAPPTVAGVQPVALCTRAGGALVITGTGFLEVDGAGPTVTIGTGSFSPTLEGCTALVGLAGVRTCTTLALDVPANLLDAGELDVVVTNPIPAACASEQSVHLTVVPPPTLTGTVPARLCSNGGRLTLTGTNFRDGTLVRLSHGTDAFEAVSVAATSATALQADFGEGLRVGGPYDLTVGTPEQCSATLAGAVAVVPAARLFFVDPPVVYDQLGIQLTAYGTGLSHAVTVELVGATTTQVLTATWSTQRASRLVIDLPAGQAPGTYGLRLRDSTGCEAELEDALRIVSTTTIDVRRVSPPFGWTAEDTGVTIEAADTGAPFQSLPRAYLSRSGAGTPVAIALESTTLLDPHTLTAVVPSGLLPGSYDLIIVNPDGGLAVETAAFTSTAQPPPAISSLAPGSLPASGTQTITLQGTNFRAPVATLACRPVATPAATPTALPIAITASSATSVTGTFNAGALSNGNVCSARITNDDGTFADFALLKITTSAENPFPSQAGPLLTVGRRALGLVAARVNDAARYLIATGGDAGAEGSAFDSVESTSVTIFGEQGGWSAQRHAMRRARTLHGAAAIGRFVYVVGGSTPDGAGRGSSATVERAALLDPAVRPEVEELELELRAVGDGGLVPGTYSYRVSALLGPGDAFSPGGETLASERFPVSLPNRLELAGRPFRLAVSWTAVAGAVGYRVYRATWTAEGGAVDRLIGELGVDVPRRFLDDGAVAGTQTPLPLGSLGTWTEVASLNTARKGLALGTVRDPDPAQPNRWYLFAMGGLDPAGAALRSIERLQVDVAAGGAQRFGAWSTLASQLSTGRWQLGAFVGTNRTSPRITPGHVFLWAGPGLDGAGTSERDIDGGEVLAGGLLPAFASVARATGRAGAGVAQAGNFLYVFGGLNGAPDTSAISAEICNGIGNGCSVPMAPDLTNPNGAGITLRTPRYLTGSVLEGATIYLVGGAAGVDGAVQATEQLVW